MAKSKHNIPPKDPNRINDMVKGGKRFSPPIPTVPQQYQYPQSSPRYQSVDEINAIYNMFLQNYERSRMEGQRAANLKEVDQYINRGFRDPIEQPVAPQFRYPFPPNPPMRTENIQQYPTPGIGGKDYGGPTGTLPPKQYPMPSIGVPPSERPGYGRPLPVPGTQVPPSSGKFGGFVPLPYPGNPGIRNPHTPIQPLKPPQQGKPPIYKAPPTGRFAPQPAPLPPVSMPDKLPQEVRGYLNPKQPKKPTLNSFIPRYERD